MSAITVDAGREPLVPPRSPAAATWVAFRALLLRDARVLRKTLNEFIPRVVSAAERAGIELVDLAVAEPTLETVFITLTGKELRE